MSRTKRTVYFGYKWRIGNRKILVSQRRAHRPQNKDANELTFTSFSQSKKRKVYKEYRSEATHGKPLEWPARCFGSRYGGLDVEEIFPTKEEKMVKLKAKLQEKIRASKDDGGGWGNRTIHVYISATKKLKRRGSILLFEGHREAGKLYKRELAFWM